MSFTDATQFWNQRFDKEEFIFGKEPNEYLVEQASQYLKPNSSILCIADGEGRNGIWLAKQGMYVTGFDVSDIALAKANQFAKDNQVNIQYSLCDTDGFNWQTNSYDAIIAIFIQFADPEMRARIFQQVHQALKPGGIFILQGYTPKQLEYKTGGPSLIEHLYTEEMIRELSQEFEILDLQCYEKELSEGARHTGMSALLGMVAKKSP
ncbi:MULTISPECIES: class I SAM-dependent methyltransferase [unclassified Polynucleobacter]|uniref:class I SAM-dependent methyltransferase n=1 Tax=unclassified Polynucleobacter TaxID=2640945 RepID=UPI0008BADEFD|nr:MULTISPECIES: class I SAM-dependent methyltransferase [unclassified Polynucleobacter]OHC09262.1 MAG: SAM-dependent methyltransferase [Polynucleobacter sp. GWA2_45_21]HBK44049.1 SAM-dependent methyltransferase [Polynucleobacter sp.]